MTNGSGGAVELVFSVQNEKNVDGTNDLGVNSEVLIVGVLVHHVEEVLSVAEILIGGINSLTSAVTVAGSSDSGSASEDTVDVLVSLLAGLVNVSSNVGRVGLGVEGGHSSHKGAHHGHGVGIMSEGGDEGFEAGVVGGVLHDLLVEGSKLLGGGEFTVNDEEGTLDEGRFFGELLNGVTTVLEDSLVSVDVGDSGDAGDGVHESGVVGAGDFTLGILNLAEVSAVDGTIGDLEFVILAYSRRC